MNVDAIKGTAENTKLLQGILNQAGLDLDRIDAIQDEAAEVAQQYEELGRITAMPIGEPVDEGELEDELANLITDGAGEVVGQSTQNGRVGAGAAPANQADAGLEDLMAAFA
jgi:hypothetical protein